MKSLTIILAVSLATLLVLRPPLYAQNATSNPDMGNDANASGQDNGEQQATPDQPGGGDEAADQGDDPNAATDQDEQNDQSEQSDSDQPNSDAGGAGDDANSASQ